MGLKLNTEFKERGSGGNKGSIQIQSVTVE